MRVTHLLLCAAALLVPMGLVQTADAQISIQIGTPPPNCPYGYYNYAPYRCAPRGYWGSNYFYNGIFLGVGPWGGWGYEHGWGQHRFSGRVYHGIRPDTYGRAVRHSSGGHSAPHGNIGHGGPEQGNAGHGGGHPQPSHGGGGSHGDSHGGGDHHDGH